jgi:hypothetical protein
MQMLLSYYRLSDAAGQIREDIYLPALQGAIPEMLVDAAANRGLHARLEHGSIESLARCLQAGTPPIVFLSSSADRQRGHFAVVTGIGEKGRMICLHTGTSPNRWRGSKEFLEAWRQTDFTSIVIAR